MGRTTECSCFKNFVYNPVAGTCVELYTRGPCPDGQLVVARPGNVLGCDCGPFLKNHFWPVDEKCYPHYERGPCKENEQFRKHPTKDNRPACIVWGGTVTANGYRGMSATDFPKLPISPPSHNNPCWTHTTQ